MSARRELSWEPRRRGAIYCAPACGGKCKWADYEAAVKAASELAERLGDGWEPRVWENLGWHWCVHDTDKLMKLYPSSGGGFHTLFSPDPGWHGRPGWSGDGKTAEEAIQVSKDAALAEILALSRVLDITVHDCEGTVISGE